MDYDEDVASQNSYYENEPTLDFAWIYIAIDIRDMSMAKVGLTTKENPFQRVLQGKTYNPFLVLFAVYELSKCTYGTSKKELYDIEGYIHSRNIFGNALKHTASGRESEWFFICPDEAEYQVDWLLAKRGFSVDGKSLYTFYSGYEGFNNIVPERMKKIKTIFRPDPIEFLESAHKSGMLKYQYRAYYDYLVSFHARDPNGKVYL